MVASAPLGTSFGDSGPGTAGMVSGHPRVLNGNLRVYVVVCSMLLCGLCYCVVYVVYVAVWSMWISGIDVLPAIFDTS